MLHPVAASVQNKTSFLKRVALLCASAAILGGLGCSGGAINIDVQDGAAEIHIDTEGNSPTPIRSLRIVTANGQGSTAYAIQGSFDFKIRDLPLHTGSNPIATFEVSHGNFRVTAPADGATTFNLQANQPYLVEVCFAHGCRQSNFTLHE
jgi:hypothetical protein